MTYSPNIKAASLRRMMLIAVSDGNAKGCALAMNGPKLDSTKKLHRTAIDIAILDGVLQNFRLLIHCRVISQACEMFRGLQRVQSVQYMGAIYLKASSCWLKTDPDAGQAV